MSTNTKNEIVEIKVDPHEVRTTDLVQVGPSRWERADQAWEWTDDYGRRKIGIKLTEFYWPIVMEAYQLTKLTVRRRKG